MRAPRSDRSWIVAGAVALVARLAVAGWAASRFPPAADGQYYHQLATRLAEGHGYTWAWPDGAVTAAAHYPIGFPAMLAGVYFFTGPSPLAAMLLGALLGSLAAVGAALAARPWGERASLAAGLVVALHPALVPYAAALMTEAIAGALLLVAAALARSRFGGRLAFGGLVLGIATLVRPQSLVLAPVLGWLARGGESRRRRAVAAAIVTVAAFVVVLPWTARNCRAMHSCALVSVNGGWNLLIGAQTDSGAWQEIQVPEECRTVWDEAAKDACFARAARRTILEAPIAALARVPAKLAVTFDYFGGGPWYLHESNPTAFDERSKWRLGALDATASRGFLLFGLLAAMRRALSVCGGRKAQRSIVWAITAVAVASALSRHAALGYLGFATLLALGGPYTRAELLLPWSAAVVFSVAATHALFFGAGRYGLVVAPFVAAVGALVAKAAVQCQDEPVGAEQAIAGSAASASEREESPSTREHDAG